MAKEFESDHVGKTITTHGPILPGTVEDAGPNRVRYKTEDGKQWEVETSRDANGNLVSGTPDALGEEPAKKDTQPDR